MDKKDFETKDELEMDIAEQALEHAPQQDVAVVESEIFMTHEQEKAIQRDRMRFVNNKLSSSLALIALVLNIFFFVSLYKSNFSYYYTYEIGISVLINLVFMLAVFLCSEGVKSYNKSYSVALIVIGVIELLRIFAFPLSAHNEIIVDADGVESLVMETAQFIRVVAYLATAAALLITAGVVGVIRSITLTNYKKSLEEKNA